jgi:hypothetical protein
MCFFLLALGSCQDNDGPDGDCLGKATHNPCYDVFDPVCGCDGKTYGNSCEAQSAGVKKYTRGTCNNQIGHKPIAR